MKLLNKYYWLYILLAATYLLSIFVEVPDPGVLERYDIARESVIWINLTGAIPLLLIWFAGFYGFLKLRRYAKKIGEDDDGLGFTRIALGIGILTFGSMLGAVVSRWLILGRNADMIERPLTANIDSHLSVLVPLIGFVFIFAGAHKLFSILHKANIASWRKAMGVVIFAVISTVYMGLVFANPNREHTTDPAVPSYFMPDWLILTTIVLPYIATLALAITSIVLIRVYYLKIRGKVYKKSMKTLNSGLFAVIAAFTLGQFIAASAGAILSWGFGQILAIIYLLIIVQSIGFILIARGAKGLTKIEEATDA